jgi:hypothetical protein
MIRRIAAIALMGAAMGLSLPVSLPVSLAQDAAPPAAAAPDGAPLPPAPVETPADMTVGRPTVKLSDLPRVLERDATFEDAVANAQGVRQSVLMGGLDKITARTFRFEAPVGVTVRFKKLLVSARSCYVRPPEETPETTVFVEINEPPAEGGETLQRLFSGWMFASSPGLNALEHPVYDVWVIGCQIDDPSAESITSSIPGEIVAPSDQPSVDETIEEDDAARE